MWMVSSLKLHFLVFSRIINSVSAKLPGKTFQELIFLCLSLYDVKGNTEVLPQGWREAAVTESRGKQTLPQTRRVQPLRISHVVSAGFLSVFVEPGAQDGFVMLGIVFLCERTLPWH